MMEKADNTIPSREELAAYIKESAVSVTNSYEQSPVVLMVDDAIIGTLGNFSASIGKAKSKKTFNVSAIVASALSGNTVLHYRSMFPENKQKILYIDTEQGQHHCQQVLKRILRLAELPDDEKPDNLLMLSLRKFAPKIRMLIVEEAIGTIPDLGLVIIDGIRDFLRIKQSRQENIMCDIHVLPSFRDLYHLMFSSECQFHYTHPIWRVGKHQQVTVARYAKV